MRKDRVLFSVLGGTERQGWLNPPLTYELIKLSHNQSFQVIIEMMIDTVLHDHARNMVLASARKHNADWCVMLDNDVCPRVDLLDVISHLAPDQLVVGVPYGIKLDGQLRPAACGQYETCGQFVRVDRVGAGCLIIKADVWRKLKWPLFRWQPKEDELLTQGISEDVHFCNRLKEAGISLWAHRQLAAHFRTTDLTEILSQQMTASAVPV